MPPRRSLLALLAVLYVLWLTTRPSADVFPTRAPIVEDYSLSVILPVIPSTLANLDELLTPFLVSTSILYEVAIVCPYSLVTDMHRKLPAVLSNASLAHPKVSLYPWSGPLHYHQASLQVIARAKTRYILLLDEHGFKQISECDRAYLVRPRAVHLPVGPRGFAASSPDWSQLSPSDRVRPAAFLVPPFVAPSSLLAKASSTFRSSLDWPLLGDYIAKSTLGSFGGIVIGTDILDTTACNPMAESNTFPDEESLDNLDFHSGLGPIPISLTGFFVLAFPREEDLRNFIPAACKLYHQGYTVLAYIYGTESSDGAIECNCTIPYFERAKETPSFSAWLDSLGLVPDVIIGLDHQDPVSSTFLSILERPPFLDTTLMRLPRHELPYTEWIGTLSLHELRRSSLFSG